MRCREEAVKLLNSLHYKILHTSFCNKVREAEIEALVMAKKLVEQPKTDWIPCEERLPSEKGQRCIVCYLNSLNKEYYIDIDIFDGKRFKFFGLNNVIAWQPLPQPYKKEGAENECN